MSPERHLLVAGVCSLAGLVDVVALGALPQWRATEQLRAAVVAGDARDRARRGEDRPSEMPAAETIVAVAAAPVVESTDTASHPSVDVAVGTARPSPTAGDSASAPARAAVDVGAARPSPTAGDSASAPARAAVDLAVGTAKLSPAGDSASAPARAAVDLAVGTARPSPTAGASASAPARAAVDLAVGTARPSPAGDSASAPALAAVDLAVGTAQPSPAGDSASAPARAAVDLAVGTARPSPPAHAADLAVGARSSPAGADTPPRAPSSRAATLLDERTPAVASARPGAHRLAVITFASEDVTPGPEARAALSRVVAQWSGALLVEGHADPSGRAEGNEYFARVRARVVAKELVLLGVDPQRLTVIGRGALAPVDTRRSPAARARNRRVEVWRAP